MKVLLIQPFKDPGFSGESYLPIGLGYLATSVKKDGHLVKIVDCLKRNYNYQDFIKSIRDFSPDLVGINLFSISVPFVDKMIDLIKQDKSNTVIVLGGPHVSSLPDKILNHYKKADFAIRGEGEIPLRGLLEAISSGKNNFSGIPGLIYRDNGELKINEPYFAKDIEEYGFPDWELLNPQDYFKYLTVGSYSVPVFFSRGCPFPCTFCAAKVTSGQNLRRRSLDHIFTELFFLQNRYGIKRFIIEDEGFGVNKKFIMDFCERVKKDNFKAQFAMGVGMRLDIVDRELLEAMKAANFEKTIVLGIESGSERILKLMKKQISLSMVWEKVRLMNSLGFEPNGYFILGYPDETREEIRKTVKLALKLPIREASFTAFQPLPATEATRMLIERGELSPDCDFTVLAQNKVTYAPRGITVKELEGIRKRAILRFYLRPRTLIRFFKSYKSFIYAFKKAIAVFFRVNVIDSKSQLISENN